MKQAWIFQSLKPVLKFSWGYRCCQKLHEWNLFRIERNFSYNLIPAFGAPLICYVTMMNTYCQPSMSQPSMSPTLCLYFFKYVVCWYLAVSCAAMYLVQRSLQVMYKYLTLIKLIPAMSIHFHIQYNSRWLHFPFSLTCCCCFKALNVVEVDTDVLTSSV